MNKPKITKALKTNPDIIPGVGLGRIRFGMSANRVEEILGRADEATLYDDNPDRTLSLAYRSGVYLSFRQSEDFRLLAIEVERNFPCKLFGSSIASLSLEKAVLLLEANVKEEGIHDFKEIQDEPAEEISLASSRLGITLYFDLSGLIESISWGVLFGASDNIVWPKD